MHVVERQPRTRQRLLPGRPLVAGLALRFGALDGLGQLGLGGNELHPPGAALVAREPLLQRRLHRPLQWRIDRRAHRVGVGGDGLDAGHRFGLPRHLVDEVEADVAPRPLVGHERRQRRQSAAGRLLRRVGLVLLHAAEHIGEPLLRPPGMPVGIEIVRPLGQAGQQRPFLQRQLLRPLAEIAAGREFDPPGAAAEIDRVEVELENLRLAQRMLEPGGHDHLADLAVIGQVLAHQEVLHDLLGDGRAALRASGLREIADEGADQAALVDALVPVEALVFGRQERLLHVLGNVGEGNPFAPLVLLEHLREAFALAVEHHARARQLDALELGVIGQIGGRLVVVVDHLAEIDRRHRHLLVLAKLPIGGLQVGKIDAAKRLVLAAHRLRVVQRRGDQVVEVDVLDVERLAHMRAARAQQPRHLFLIPAAVKLRLHRVRRRRHLTECKRRGKYLDEETFHG